MKDTSELHAGEWVQVRSKEEILATLDQKGQLEGLPFMPEMFEHCGKRVRVFKRAHKTCDPPNGLHSLRMPRAVHLEGVRCNGNSHGGCQARCLVFWKDAWLKRLDPPSSEEERRDEPTGCTEQDVIAGTRDEAEQARSGEPVFICQSTQVPQAAQRLRWWEPRQYWEDYTSGNVRLSQLLAGLLFSVAKRLSSKRLGLRSPLMWIYDAIQKMRGGTPFPLRGGEIVAGNKTPAARLDLQPGELVKVRSYPEILATIDENGNNRGMVFDAEMVPYCGGTYRVLDHVRTIINEKTGRMQHLKNDCIVLDEVICLARYAKCRRFCPRSIYPYWREIWLERAGETSPRNVCN